MAHSLTTNEIRLQFRDVMTILMESLSERGRLYGDQDAEIKHAITTSIEILEAVLREM